MRRDELVKEMADAFADPKNPGMVILSAPKIAGFILRREREMAEKIRSYLVNGTYNTSIGKALNFLDDIIKEVITADE